LLGDRERGSYYVETGKGERHEEARILMLYFENKLLFLLIFQVEFPESEDASEMEEKIHNMQSQMQGSAASRKLIQLLGRAIIHSDLSATEIVSIFHWND
jgi:hypothetical protein